MSGTNTHHGLGAPDIYQESEQGKNQAQIGTCAISASNVNSRRPFPHSAREHYIIRGGGVTRAVFKELMTH